MKNPRCTSANNTVLITGIGGFIGFNLAMHYHRAGCHVVGIERGTTSQLPAINKIRLQKLHEKDIHIDRGDLAEAHFVLDTISRHRPDLIFHMAANANVRCAEAKKFSENIAGIVNVLTAASAHPPKHFLYASSSSVYSENTPRPFCENSAITLPVSTYAKSKFAGEIIANVWAKRDDFPITGLRFFNVYGPWGRPEMALFRFADSLALGKETTIISGDTSRAWLYIDDAIQACTALAEIPPDCKDETRIVNIAGPRLINTMDALHTISKLLNKTPLIVHFPPAFKEVSSNPADTTLLKSLTGKVPQIDFEYGIKIFLEWHSNEWMPLLKIID